jgi:hypothetical protein
MEVHSELNAMHRLWKNKVKTFIFVILSIDHLCSETSITQTERVILFPGNNNKFIEFN